MSLPSAKKRKIFDGRYEIISIVGRGLDSVVYHAKHLSGGQQEVALKVLINNKPKSSLTERLRKEALTLVSCRHKYVVRLDDFHSVADLCYLSMEYAPLGDLRKFIANSGKPLSPELGADFLRQSLEGMEFIHATGVLHRDLKPDNILVINDKEIRLADFGLALLPGDELDLEELQNGVGSLSYLPPELLDGKFYDSRSDLYSLGVCFYEALAGSHPFDQVSLSEQLEVRRDQNIKPLHEINPLIPKRVSAVVTTLMRYSADDRFQSALDALRALSNSEFTGATTTVATETEPAHEDLAEISGNTTVAAPANQETYTAANNDQSESAFTDDFEDFFGDTDYSAAHTVTEPEKASPDTATSSNDTEEMSAQRVQQLIQQDETRKSLSQTRRGTSVATPTTSPSSSAAPLEKVAQELESEDFSQAPHRKYIKPAKVSLLHRLLDMPLLTRTVVVGACAAVITIGMVVLSHVKPSKLLPASLSASEEAGSETTSEDVGTSHDSIFPKLPAGTYAGTIQGVLPGVTSPLALIARPEQNTVTVVIGIEGWTPSTVSTDSEEGDSASTIIIRSNSVLLTIKGTGSPDEASGTFSNAITGETGEWSVRKVS
jgi:serine/threonine protein kinase